MPYKDDEAQATDAVVKVDTVMPALGEFPPAHDSVKLFLVVHYHSTPEEALKLLSSSTTELPLGQHFRTRQGRPLLPEGSFLHKTGKFRFHVKSLSLATMYPLISTTRMRYPHLRRLGIVILSEETLSVPQVSYLVAILKHYGAQINELSLWIKAGLARDGPHGENLVSTLDPLWAQLNSQANQLGSLVLDIQLHPPAGFEYPKDSTRAKEQQKVYPINLSALLPKLSRFKFGSANNSCNVDESLRTLMDTPKTLMVKEGKKKVKGEVKGKSEVKSDVNSEVKDKSESGSKSKSSEQKDSKDNKSGEDKPKQKKTGKKKKPRKRKKKTKKKKRVNPQAHGYQYAQPLPDGAQPTKIANRVFCAKLNQIAVRVKSAKADELVDHVNAFSNLQLLTVFVDNPQVSDEMVLKQIGSYHEKTGPDDSKSQSKSKSLEKKAPPKVPHLVSLRLHFSAKYPSPFSFDPVNPKDGTILSIRHLYSLTLGLINGDLFVSHGSFAMNSLSFAFPNLQGLVLLVKGPVPRCDSCGPDGARQHLALLLGNLDRSVPFDIKSCKVVRVDFVDSGSSFEITRADVAELYPNDFPPEIPKIVTKKATKRSKGKKPKAITKPVGSQIEDGTKPDSTIGSAIDSNANSELSSADTYAISTVDDKAEKSGKSSQEKSEKDSSNSDSKQKDKKKKEKEKSGSENAELTSSEMKKRKKRAAKKAKAKDPYDDLEADYLANLFGNEDDEDNDDEEGEEEEDEQSSEYESEDIAKDDSVVENNDGSAVEKSGGSDQNDAEEGNEEEDEDEEGTDENEDAEGEDD